VKELVVIGSGAGGLCAAILLGQRGWRVTVLEQHYRAGADEVAVQVLNGGDATTFPAPAFRALAAILI